MKIGVEVEMTTSVNAAGSMSINCDLPKQYKLRTPCSIHKQHVERPAVGVSQ